MLVREYRVEKQGVDQYKNGAWFFMQPAMPRTTVATAHIHEAIEILYIYAGGYTAYLDDVEYNLFEGDLLLVRSGIIHHMISDAAKEHGYYVLKIHPELWRSLSSPQTEDAYALALSLSRPTSKCCWKKDELPQETKAGLDMLIRDYKSETAYADVAIKLAVGAILLGLLRTDTAEAGERISVGRETDKIIYEAMAYIRRNYSETLSIESLAKKFNISYSYFSRIFNEITGRNFKAYVNAVRISHAERMLCSGKQSISEVAAACGYNDVAYFIKVFREQKGCSPKVYRKLSAKKE